MTTLSSTLSPLIEAQIAAARALIFDCDGTLADSGPVYVRAWAEGFRLSGREMDAAWYHGHNGLSESTLMDAFEALHGVTLDREAVVARVRTAYLDYADKVAEITTVAAIARAWHGRKPMAVASGGPAANVIPTLKVLKLDHLFDTVVTFDDVGQAKPSPALFLEAARRLGIAPGDCLVFEDSPQGLDAAARAHMTAIDVGML